MSERGFVSVATFALIVFLLYTSAEAHGAYCALDLFGRALFYTYLITVCICLLIYFSLGRAAYLSKVDDPDFWGFPAFHTIAVLPVLMFIGIIVLLIIFGMFFHSKIKGEKFGLDAFWH